MGLLFLPMHIHAFSTRWANGLIESAVCSPRRKSRKKEREDGWSGRRCWGHVLIATTAAWRKGLDTGVRQGPRGFLSEWSVREVGGGDARW